MVPGTPDKISSPLSIETESKHTFLEPKIEVFFSKIQEMLKKIGVQFHPQKNIMPGSAPQLPLQKNN